LRALLAELVGDEHRGLDGLPRRLLRVGLVADLGGGGLHLLQRTEDVDPPLVGDRARAGPSAGGAYQAPMRGRGAIPLLPQTCGPAGRPATAGPTTACR
jgi:hypothetical protein